MSDFISAEEALQSAKSNGRRGFAWLDVRSEGEFAEGSLPYSINVPILNDEHRREVGLTYKSLGNAAAVEVGQKLVHPLKIRLVDSWRESLKSQAAPILYCWRGGLRSRFAQDWLKESGFAVLRVQGGYKRLRGLLLSELRNLPPLLVLSGKTGSRKTPLLRSLPAERVLDLEGLANHRGSTFGGLLKTVQPAQATFENHFFWQLYGGASPRLIEDESRMVGHCILPPALYEKMIQSDRVVVESSLEDRAGHIAEEYVLRPMEQGTCSTHELKTHFLDGMARIRKRTGGLLYQDLVSRIETAFAGQADDAEAHRSWISSLLENYYDKAYEYALSKKTGKIAFHGSYEECRQWLEERWLGRHD